MGRWRPSHPQFRSLTGHSPAWLAQRRHPAVTRGQEHACLPRPVPARPHGTGDKGSSLSPSVLGTLPSKTEWEGEEALLLLPHPRQYWERFTTRHHPRLTEAVECSGTVCQDPRGRWEQQALLRLPTLPPLLCPNSWASSPHDQGLMGECSLPSQVLDLGEGGGAGKCLVPKVPHERLSWELVGPVPAHRVSL